MRFGFLSTDVAIDLGTANTLIWIKDKGDLSKIIATAILLLFDPVLHTTESGQ